MVGRPLALKPRKNRHTFRFNDDEEIAFQRKLNKLNARQKSFFIREAVIDKVKHDC